MYNPVKPKFSDAVKVLLVFTLVIMVIYQNTVIGDLSNRVDRIEKNEREFSVSDEIQMLVENVNELLVEHDKNIRYLYLNWDDLDDYLERLDERINTLEDNNKELQEIIHNQNTLLLNISIKNNLTVIIPMVETRKTPFRIGDTIAWNIESDYLLEGAKITTWFPNGTIAWETGELTDWIYRDETWTIPYYKQVTNSKPMVFLEAYPLGNYTYSFTYRDIFEINGSFEVLEALEQTLDTG